MILSKRLGSSTNQIINTITNINHKKKKKIIKFNDIKKSNQNSNIIIGKKKKHILLKY